MSDAEPQQMDRKELVAWINEYIANHKCRSCDGTGAVGCSPWRYACERCNSTGLDHFSRKEKPTFDKLFLDILKAKTMEEVRSIVIKYQKHILISEVFHGHISKDWMKFLIDKYTG